MRPGARRFHHCRPRPSAGAAASALLSRARGLQGARFPDTFPCPPGRGAGCGLGVALLPALPLADISCVFGADTLILKPGIPEGLRDPRVPSPPSSPAWQDCLYYCNGSRSWAAPDPAPAGRDHILVLYSWSCSLWGGGSVQVSPPGPSLVEGTPGLAGPLEDRYPLPSRAPSWGLRLQGEQGSFPTQSS